jgi:hypothetical protein
MNQWSYDMAFEDAKNTFSEYINRSIEALHLAMKNIEHLQKQIVIISDIIEVINRRIDFIEKELRIQENV